MPLTARQSIEVFHLVFLRALLAKGEDKALIALKGGCNLRFYFGSARYSEDIDFDVMVIGKATLRNKVDRLLKSPLVASPLKSHGIEVVEVTAPKQGDTTQRWKAGLRVHGLSVPLRTKIEFSRRGSIEGASYESVDAGLARGYGLTSTLATHYNIHAAITQKVTALAGRTEPQARDLFDLNLLFTRPDAAGLVLKAAQKTGLAAAIERAIGISFDEYKSRVVAYLEPSAAGLFDERDDFQALQEFVVSSLEALR